MNITNNNRPKLNSVSGVYNNNSTMCLEYILITKGMIMKTIKLTKKQYEVLRSAFIQGADSHSGTLNDDGFDLDGNVISKESAKKYHAYMRILKRLEIKFNCKVC